VMTRKHPSGSLSKIVCSAVTHLTPGIGLQIWLPVNSGLGEGGVPVTKRACHVTGSSRRENDTCLHTKWYSVRSVRSVGDARSSNDAKDTTRPRSQNRMVMSYKKKPFPLPLPGYHQLDDCCFSLFKDPQNAMKKKRLFGYCRHANSHSSTPCVTCRPKSSKC
jgi:hypothetical protein